MVFQTQTNSIPEKIQPCSGEPEHIIDYLQGKRFVIMTIYIHIIG